MFFTNAWSFSNKPSCHSITFSSFPSPNPPTTSVLKQGTSRDQMFGACWIHVPGDRTYTYHQSPVEMKAYLLARVSGKLLPALDTWWVVPTSVTLLHMCRAILPFLGCRGTPHSSSLMNYEISLKINSLKPPLLLHLFIKYIHVHHSYHTFPQTHQTLTEYIPCGIGELGVPRAWCMMWSSE